MIAAYPWSPYFQGLLDGLGWLIAQIYDFIPNYGLTIIVLTVLIRLVLLPLGIKQIRSMQHMQLVQPKIKALQQKYKGNKQKQQEEVMKLYREYGVNPFSGCWPVLLQFPILIAMYSVLRFPQHPIHIPEQSKLYADVITAQIPPVTSLSDCVSGLPDNCHAATEPGPSGGTGFLGMNLLCSAREAGNPEAQLVDNRKVDGKPVVYPVDCGSGAATRIPYYLFVVLMFGTTYFQQRQMQKASPPGASSSQQQALLRIMPIFFGVFGFFFPAGLVVYWTTSNLWQIGQQYFMLRTRPTAEELAARADGKKGRKGFMASLMDRVADERQRREGPTGKPGERPKPGPPTGRTPPPPKRPGSGGNSGRNRRKRPKR
ncbi:MAG TPA: YidC/Oxa1 family membrane protein insertase [Actinomycetota bacterium]|nr:YidC/Oxa1 family membrane protein insertase [Actinomycetota bacterium]